MSAEPLARPAAAGRRPPGARPGGRPLPTAGRPVAPAKVQPPKVQQVEARPRPRRAPFAAVLVALLGAGLAGVLFLTTSLEQGSFRLDSLLTRQSLLGDREQALNTQLQLETGPQRLAARAGTYGMVVDTTPAFLRLPSGLVTGDSPLAGHHVPLHHAPADGIWIGPGWPPPPPPAPPARHRNGRRSARHHGHGAAGRRGTARAARRTHATPHRSRPARADRRHPRKAARR